MTRVAVGQWLSGQSKPKQEKREHLRAAYGIPESAWDEPPGASIPRAAPPVASAAAPSRRGEQSPVRVATVPEGVLEKMAVLERMATDLMNKVRADEAAAPLEQARVMASIAQTLHLLAKASGQLDLGSRLTQLPIWKGIEKALERGLDGHPEVAAAVARELYLADESLYFVSFAPSEKAS